jgi:hypothetical protein
VVFVLSTRDFRDPDLGVILWLRNVDTGVDMSSLTPPGVLFSERGLGSGVGVEAVGGADPATLGVNGVRLAVFAAAALRVGMRGLDAFCLSE